MVTHKVDVKEEQLKNETKVPTLEERMIFVIQQLSLVLDALSEVCVELKKKNGSKPN